MFRKLKTRIVASAGVLVLATGFALSMASTPAHALLTYGWCTTINSSNECLNAWSGGPFVDTYSSPNTNNSFFGNRDAGGGFVELQLQGGFSGWSGHCIGDAYNDPNNASTSLDNCPTSTGNAGWGTNYEEFSCTRNGNPGYSFLNAHWAGWLGPQTNGNGFPFYQNKPSEYCFQYYPTYI